MTRTFNYGHPLRVVGTVAAHNFYSKYIRPWKDEKNPPWSHYSKPAKTKTKPLSKKNIMAAEDIPIGVKKTVVNLHLPLRHLKGVSPGHISYRDSTSALLVVDEGYQNLVAPLYIGTTSQWLTGTSNAVASNRDSVAYNAWFSMNPLQGIPAGTIVSAQTTPTNDKMGLHSSTTYFDFKNDTTNICYYKVHVYMSKTDSNVSPVAEFHNAFTANQIYNANSNFATAVGTVLPTNSGNESDTLYIGASTTQIESVNTLPYTNLNGKRLVRSTWKKIKTISHVFSGGDAWKLIVNIKHNQFAIRERLNTLGVSFPKGCVCFVFEMQGGTVYNTSNSTFNYSACQMAVAITRKIHLAPMSIPNKRFESYYTGAGRVFQGALLGTEKDLYHNTEAANIPAKIL